MESGKLRFPSARELEGLLRLRVASLELIVDEQEAGQPLERHELAAQVAVPAAGLHGLGRAGDCFGHLAALERDRGKLRLAGIV